VDGNTALQVGQGEGGLAVSAVGCTDQIEQGVILIDCHQGSVAKGPAYWRKISAKHSNLTDERA
jgi:hypothetical protein